MRYLEWTGDPDPADTWIVTEYAFLFRDADGAVAVAHETHRTGPFGRDVWLRLLGDADFDPVVVGEQTAEERVAREAFVGRRRPQGATSPVTHVTVPPATQIVPSASRET